MKTLTGVLALMLALIFGASSVVVAKEPIGGPGGTERMRPSGPAAPGIEMKQPATGEKTVDKASPQLMKVKVLKVNESAKTFTVMVKGEEKTLNVPDLRSLPKPGDIIEITVSNAGGGGTARLVCVTVQYGTKKWCCYFFNGAPSGCGYL